MLSDDPATNYPVTAGSDPAAPGYDQPPVPVGVPTRRSGMRVLPLAVGLVAVLAGGALFMSGYLVGQRSADQPGTPAGREQAFQPFWDTYDAITKRYAGGEIDQQKLVTGAIDGMVGALGDPYSTYLTLDEYKTGLQDLSGQFEGIGAEIGTRTADGSTKDCATLGPDCRLVVVSPIAGSPAEKAGLRPGDTIVAVDGATIDGLSVDGARDRIRGKKGTEVRLRIERTGRQPFEVAVVRDVIVQQEVIDKDLAGGDVGYLRLTGFSDNAANTLHEKLKADIDAGRKKIILDLRGNPGGYVTAARRIASEFIGSGPVFWEQDAGGTQTPTDATGDGVATGGDVQVVALVDRGSASASEIVAGALHDTHRAKLVGETTFGKGTVQQWIELGDSGAVKLTIARWLTPDKHWIHNVGIQPDVGVTVPPDQPAGDDLVIDKALEVLGEPAG
jgi:carboxyl-terminal processing protease